MNKTTRLAVTRPQIAKCLGISLSSLHVALAVFDSDEIAPIQYQSAPGQSLRTVYILTDIDAYLRRVCSERYTSFSAERLAAGASEIRVA
ncbi:MAG: hypothetical protein JWS10_87 [Cypionkella sp.]|uniref:hypothetical protein n=1 Tax=Cypionkella sp. TaxID=2811411 RepID=UPI00262FC793|nr:hypothetical protein [Cypionkella sp.]MDB5657472.1 hypothetical protein [Cypionkella sp.]